ncbi:GTP diphosphokinase CRSH3, chloroplastic [Oryza glaberrima]|uniref:GTP diphosphokinase n=1 Tax=Oryza glaberrima TaxID=4538 RepID=I1PSQ2_ORYGL|nr:GTP diphosphokinase CRSH3, chloroplastic [Oryza glaberrima]
MANAGVNETVAVAVAIDAPGVGHDHGAAGEVRRPSTRRLAPAGSGGRLMAELLGVFNGLTERMGEDVATSSSSRLLFRALKLALPALRDGGGDGGGGQSVSRALVVAASLADLQMDAEVISAGMVRGALDAGALAMADVEAQLGASAAGLVEESLKVKRAPSEVDVADEEAASALRKRCLSSYDIRAVILELAVKLDAMKHLDVLPKHQQRTTSLEVLKVFAPLAHAVGAGELSLELEDLSFQRLYPQAYVHIDQWLSSQEDDCKRVIAASKEELLRALTADDELRRTVTGVDVMGRYKSRFSTMKKLVKDGRRPEDVNDILGMRVILDPRPGAGGDRACLRTHEVIKAMWKDVPARTKDYITRPKGNGYRSLHVAVDMSEPAPEGKKRPLMEIQVRTREMDMAAVGGQASHALYKGGLTDPEEAKRLKAIMLAAAEVAAQHLRDEPAGDDGQTAAAAAAAAAGVGNVERAFQLLDKNGDGRISMEELTEIMEDLGAGGHDAEELMRLLDANSDGSLSSDEFALFQKRVELKAKLEDKDDEYKEILEQKLQKVDDTGLIHVYRKNLSDKLVLA